jgi:phospholipid/cholesterol/gamma-HCH transport system ATP-binding protein
MTREVIMVKDIYKSFDKKKVLNGATFNLHKKENIVLLGKSGGGKSVLLKIIVGLIEPDQGEVIVLGNDMNKISESDLIVLRKKIGYLFQEGALYDSMTVGENISFSYKRKDKEKTPDEIEEAVMNALKRVGLSEAIDKMPDELSGGMKKRVALARTMILEPEIILYDEPTTGLDPVTAKEIIRLIVDMKEKFGISSIIATHDMLCARMTADRIMVLHEGKIGIEGGYEELDKSKLDWVQDFFK